MKFVRRLRSEPGRRAPQTEAKVSPRIRRELHEFSAIRRITDGRARLRTVTSSVDATLRDLGTIEEIAPLKKKLSSASIWHRCSATLGVRVRERTR